MQSASSNWKTNASANVLQHRSILSFGIRSAGMMSRQFLSLLFLLSLPLAVPGHDTVNIVGKGDLNIKAAGNIDLSTKGNVTINRETIGQLIDRLRDDRGDPGTVAPTGTFGSCDCCNRVAALEAELARITYSMSLPRNCKEAYKSGRRRDGVYTVDLRDSLGPFDVYCDMTTTWGGWTVFQRRQDGSVDFYRNWTDYRNGFGNLTGEFWLGLDKISRLAARNQVLRVDLEDFQHNTRYANYSKFSVGDESMQYSLTVGQYSGNAGDSLTADHNGMKFTTKDSDNDLDTTNCAVRYEGGWWYRACHNSNLNGRYLKGAHSSYANGINWNHWHGFYYSLKFTEMKLR